MKQQTRFYVSRKNPLTWFAAALSLASIVLQILALCLGEGAVISTVNIWFQKDRRRSTCTCTAAMPCSAICAMS